MASDNTFLKNNNKNEFELVRFSNTLSDHNYMFYSQREDAFNLITLIKIKWMCFKSN